MCLKTEARNPQQQIAGIQSAILDDSPKTNYLGNVQVFMEDICNFEKGNKTAKGLSDLNCVEGLGKLALTTLETTFKRREIR